MGIITSISNGVCELKLNRPDVFNSFNKAMALELQNALDNCATNDSIRAIVITGEGKAFCAGQDLAEATDPNGPELKSILAYHSFMTLLLFILWPVAEPPVTYYTIICLS